MILKAEMITRKHMAIINSSFNLSMSAGGHAMSSLQMHARVQRICGVAHFVNIQFIMSARTAKPLNIKPSSIILCVFIQTVTD